MNNLDRLIAELCPDGVELITIGETAECCAGAALKLGMKGHEAQKIAEETLAGHGFESFTKSPTELIII